MTSFDRFDPFETRIVDALDEIAAPRRPDYLDDVFRQTARSSQRPRWTFPERWLPMDSAIGRSAAARRLPVRPLLVLALTVLLIAAAAAIYVGSQRRLPDPFGPADNGQLAYGINGDLVVRDTLTGESRLLVGGPGEQSGPLYSPNGLLVAFDSVVDDVDHVTVAHADGSGPTAVLDEPFVDGSASWSPDSQFLALSTEPTTGARSLWIAPADGSGARKVQLPGLTPRDAVYNPANDGTLLVRADDASGTTDLYLVDLAGHVVRRYNLPGDNVFGPAWELSGPVFSPDGRTIAHNSVEQTATGAVFRTYLVDVDGSNQRLLPEPLDQETPYSQAWPIYSPDGNWILMESWVGTPGGPATNQLAIAPADGSAPARGIGPKIANQSLVKAWSPDGTTILMAARDIGEIYQVDPVTGASTKLPWAAELPDWQRTRH